MKPLVTNRRVLTWLSVFSTDDVTSKWKKLAHIAFTFYIISAILSSLAASVAYFTKNVKSDLEGSLYALFQISAFSGTTYMIIVTFFQRHKLVEIFNKLNEIYDNNSADQSRYLAQANNKSEWIWGLFFKVVICGFFLSTAMMCFTSVLLCCISNGGFDAKFLYYPYRIVLPWNQKVPIGYFGDVCFVIAVVEAYFICNGSLLLLFISMCWHHQAFYETFQYSMSKFGDLKQNNHAFLNDLIRFHNLVKSWFLDSAEVYSLYILVILVCSMIFMACIIFQLDLEMKHVDFNLSILLQALMVSTLILFLYCYFGKLATESFEKMTDGFFESNWPDQPVDLQKYFILIIGNMQRPLFYHGFGIAELKLELFLKMLKTVLTYYMMFKTITNK